MSNLVSFLRKVLARLKPRSWRSVAREIVFFVAILGALMYWQGRNLLPASSRESAPTFTLQSLEGSAYSIPEGADVRTVLYFFAPWCGVCHMSIENMEAQTSRRGIERVHAYYIALDYDGDVESVRRFVAQHKLTSPVLLGTDEVRDAYHVAAYPTFYVLDEKGHVRWGSSGYSTGFGMWWRLRF